MVEGCRACVHSPLMGQGLWSSTTLNALLPMWRRGYDLDQSGDRVHTGYSYMGQKYNEKVVWKFVNRMVIRTNYWLDSAGLKTD